MKLKLKQEAGQTLDIGHGEYKRQFNRDDQPFTVSEEESVLLLKTGLFEVSGVPRVEVDAGNEKSKATNNAKPNTLKRDSTTKE